MAEINTEVYDIFHPTPVSLKDLSAIAVSLQIWRCEVKKYRSSDDALKRFDPESRNISSKTVLPDLPSVFYATIDKYVTKFGFSMRHWLLSHHERVFRFQYNHQNHVLRFFDDFVCDYGGSIDYTRTAERMMRCDRFDVQQKFVIACTYFFEDDIRRLWTLVSSTLDLKNINFFASPQLYYWICCLRNELHKIPIPIPIIRRWDNQIEGIMLSNCMTHNRPSVEYFWNRLPAESRRQKAYDLYQSDVHSFARYIFPKLDDQELDEFINDEDVGFEMIRALCRIAWYDKEFIASSCMRIRNIISESVFINEIIIMLQFENRESVSKLGQYYITDYEEDEDGSMRRNWFNLCCEIWNSAPEKLKRSAAREITSNNRLFGDLWGYGYSTPPEPKEYVFFSTFLSYATYEQRKSLWSDCWERLIIGTRCKDFKKIMNLCFENEDEITEFKENVLARSDEFRNVCEHFLRAICLDELNEFVSLSYPETQAARNFKQQLLQSVFIGDRRSLHCSGAIIVWSNEFNEFINDAFNDTDLAWDFKNQLVSLPDIRDTIGRTSLYVPVENVAEFMDRFVSSEQILLQIKTHLIDFLTRPNNIFTSAVPESSLRPILSWCLGNNEEVEKFITNRSNNDPASVQTGPSRFMSIPPLPPTPQRHAE